MIIGESPPKSIELHLSYRCDLACPCCNRACFAGGDWRAPDLTIADAERFVQQSMPLVCKFDSVIIIGGEPTLNPDCLSIMRMLQILRLFNPALRLVIYSNYYSDAAKSVIAQIEAEELAEIYAVTFKPGGSVATHPYRTIFLSPLDYGLVRVSPCPWHSWGGCGISADARGYTACPLGGMICDVLSLGVRQTELAAMFDRSVVQEQTDVLCRHCGACMDEVFMREIKPTKLRWYGWTPMSRTWLDAFNGERHA